MRAPRPTSNRHLSEIGGPGKASHLPTLAYTGPGRTDFFPTVEGPRGTSVSGYLMLDDNQARNGVASVVGLTWEMTVPDLISSMILAKPEHLRDAGLLLLPEDTDTVHTGTLYASSPTSQRTGAVLTLTPVTPVTELVDSTGTTVVTARHGAWFKASFDEPSCLWVDGLLRPRFASDSVIEEYGGYVA